VATSDADPPASERGSRREVVREFKRQLIRDAAKKVFADRGMEGASVREIAKAAGYTTGALYTHFATREELYADVLRDSLDALHREMRRAIDEARSDLTVSGLRALWGFYQSRRADFELGFYLYGGARPTGLTPVLDRELNAQLDGMMALLGDCLVTDGRATADTAHHIAVAHATWVFGLLLMTKTGRLRSLREDPEALLDTYLTTLSTTSA
jgi:AcrR family transcriptional regulator